MSVKILTDSGCDLPKDIIDEYDIDVLPIIVIKDDEEYLDGVTIEPKELYDNMRAGQVYLLKCLRKSLKSMQKKGKM